MAYTGLKNAGHGTVIVIMDILNWGHRVKTKGMFSHRTETAFEIPSFSFCAFDTPLLQKGQPWSRRVQPQGPSKPWSL